MLIVITIIIQQNQHQNINNKKFLSNSILFLYFYIHLIHDICLMNREMKNKRKRIKKCYDEHNKPSFTLHLVARALK